MVGGAFDADPNAAGAERPQLTVDEAKEWLEDVEAIRVAYGIVHEKMFQFVLARYRGDINTTPTSLGLDTPLAFFLPSSRAGKGVLSMALLNALVNINNEFLVKAGKCGSASFAAGLHQDGDESDGGGGSMMDTDADLVGGGGAAATRGGGSPLRDLGSSKNTIAISSVHKSNVAGLDQYTELLPVVLKHSTIPLYARQGSQIMYDFDEIEWQLLEQLVRPARIIDLESVKASKMFTYSTDLCNETSFAAVRLYVRQTTPASGEVDLNRLVDEFSAQSQLAEAVETLESAISFVAATQTDMNRKTKLSKYLTDVLQYSDDNVFVQSQLAEQIELQHVLAVWQRCELFATLQSMQTELASVGTAAKAEIVAAAAEAETAAARMVAVEAAAAERAAAAGSRLGGGGEATDGTDGTDGEESGNGKGTRRRSGRKQKPKPKPKQNTRSSLGRGGSRRRGAAPAAAAAGRRSTRVTRSGSGTSNDDAIMLSSSSEEAQDDDDDDDDDDDLMIVEPATAANGGVGTGAAAAGAAAAAAAALGMDVDGEEGAGAADAEEIPADAIHEASLLAFPALVPAYHNRLTTAQKELILAGAEKCPPHSRLQFLGELREYLLVCSSSAEFREKNRQVPDYQLLMMLNAVIVKKNDENGIDDDDDEDFELPDMEWLEEMDPEITLSLAAAVWALVASVEVSA